MNLTELRDELSTRAADIEPRASLAGGVADKITSTRRRRASGMAGAACLLAVAVGFTAFGPGRASAPVVPAGGSSPTVFIGPNGMPLRQVAPAAGDIERDGLRYRAQVADDRLATAAIGAPGQPRVSMTWTPTTTHVSLGADCWQPGADPQNESRAMAWLVVDGKRVFGSTCNVALPSDGLLQAGGIVPGEPGRGWTELTIGKPVTMTIEVLDQKTDEPVNDPELRVAGSIYVQGAQRDVVDPSSGTVVASLPQVQEHQGYRYRLDAVTSVPAASAFPTLPTPTGTPFIAVYGSAGVGTGSFGTDYLTGLDEETGHDTSGGQATAVQPARTGGSVTLRHEGAKPTRGVNLIAIYTLEPRPATTAP